MKKIESESRHVLRVLKDLFMLPLILVLVIFGKREKKELFNVFKTVWNFLWEAKVVAWLIVVNIVLFFGFSVYIASVGIADDQELQEKMPWFIDIFVNEPRDIFEGNYLSLIGSGFMHVNIGHLLFNMLALFILGRVVEKNFGASKTLIIYFGSLIISNIATSLLHVFVFADNIGGMGASGAICGITAAAVITNPFYTTYLLGGIPIPIILVGYAQLLEDIFGIINPKDNIGHVAHLAGFFAIVILSFFLSPEDKRKLKRGLLINLIALVVFFILWWVFFRGRIGV